MSSFTKKEKKMKFFEILRGRSILGLNSYIPLVVKCDRATIDSKTQFLDNLFKMKEIIRKNKTISIINLKKSKNYRGRRHSANLPCNGQRTHTNSRTRRKYFIS